MSCTYFLISHLLSLNVIVFSDISREDSLSRLVLKIAVPIQTSRADSGMYKGCIMELQSTGVSISPALCFFIQADREPRDSSASPDKTTLTWRHTTVYTYTTLKATNVLSTLACLALCSTGKPKHMTLVSSTAVLDTAHYASLITPISESDSLQGSRNGLSTGYAQSKYVSEFLMREAGRRGLRGSVVRPG